jgi:hypothetical protein
MNVCDGYAPRFRRGDTRFRKQDATSQV